MARRKRGEITCLRQGLPALDQPWAKDQALSYCVGQRFRCTAWSEVFDSNLRVFEMFLLTCVSDRGETSE